MGNVRLYAFDRGKIFYPYIMHYIYSIHGFIELISRGAVNQLNKYVDKEEKIKFLQNSGIDKNIRNFLDNPHTTPLIGDLQFRVTNGKNIQIDIDEIAQDFINNGLYLVDYYRKCAGILLIATFQVVSDWDDPSDPIWNFYYHCRNAAAHGSRFKIEKDRFPAKWNGLEITKDMSGKVDLFKDQNGSGFLSFGDPVNLLWDIEQKYASMKL